MVIRFLSARYLRLIVSIEDLSSFLQEVFDGMLGFDSFDL